MQSTCTMVSGKEINNVVDNMSIFDTNDHLDDDVLSYQFGNMMNFLNHFCPQSFVAAANVDKNLKDYYKEVDGLKFSFFDIQFDKNHYCWRIIPRDLRYPIMFIIHKWEYLNSNNGIDTYKNFFNGCYLPDYLNFKKGTKIFINNMNNDFTIEEDDRFELMTLERLEEIS